MKNKFVDLYPQLIPCKVGDLIIIVEGEEPYFSTGDIGRLYRSDSEGCWWANFNNLDNKKIHDDGKWCVYFENKNFRKYTKNTQKEEKTSPNTQKV